MKQIICFFTILALTCGNLFPDDQWEHGLIPIGDKGDDMFYLYFESRNDPANDPLIVWLTGGPGCASEVALFFENGPYKIEDDLQLKNHPETWNTFANLLYVDQPLGTGFSFGRTEDYVSGERGVAKDFGIFIKGFLDKHPELEGRDFYITGESYAGHYIPAISYHLLYEFPINLNMKGIAIGDGLVDPYHQYPAYATFSYENGLIGEATYNSLVKGFEKCQEAILTNVSMISIDVCQIQVEVIIGNPLKPKFNVYDIREKCDKPPLCYDFTNADKLLNENKTLKELGVEGRSWVECSQEVHTVLIADMMNDLSPKLTGVLAKGIDILAYHGDKDFICNWRGGEAWTTNVVWPHQDAFNQTAYKNWTVNGEVVGEMKEYENLHFLKVFDAGHMVPMDKPKVALQMLKEFINHDIEITA